MPLSFVLLLLHFDRLVILLLLPELYQIFIPFPFLFFLLITSLSDSLGIKFLFSFQLLLNLDPIEFLPLQIHLSYIRLIGLIMLVVIRMETFSPFLLRRYTFRQLFLQLYLCLNFKQLADTFRICNEELFLEIDGRPFHNIAMQVHLLVSNSNRYTRFR